MPRSSSSSRIMSSFWRRSIHGQIPLRNRDLIFAQTASTAAMAPTAALGLLDTRSYEGIRAIYRALFDVYHSFARSVFCKNRVVAFELDIEEL
jgi:hypothetical protein